MSARRDLTAALYRTDMSLAPSWQFPVVRRLSFRISGQLWSQPVPLELLLHTDIDLETGRVEIKELAR